MAGSKLGVFNEALGWLGQRKLASLAENREPRRYLDDEWTQGVNFCLGQAYWNHAKRFVKIDAEQEIIPQFGFKYCFQKPDDWVRTYQVADNDAFNLLMRRYTDMNNFLYASITPLYFKYISNDPDFGWNMALWTEDFVQYLAVYLADKIKTRIRGISDQQMQELRAEVKRVKKNAAAHDAMNLPVGEPPVGTWVVSRFAPYSYGGGDGGLGGDGLTSTPTTPVVPVTSAPTVAQVQRQLVALGAFDTIEAALPGPTDSATISWRVGGTVNLGGPLSNLIEVTLGYTNAQMITFLNAAAALIM